MPKHTQDDYPPNIVEATRLLAASLILIFAPFQIDLDALQVHSTEVDMDEKDEHEHTMTIKFRI